MTVFKGLRNAAVVVCVAVGLLAVVASGAWGAATVLCMKNANNGAMKGPTVPGGSECKAGFNKITLPSSEELEVLNKVMPHVKYQEKGVGGKPTIQVSGVNVQIVNGEGKTASTNGAGNLVIGYDEEPGEQTGSHDLLLGTNQTFTSYAGIIAGAFNKLTGPFASITGGNFSTASGPGATVSGGKDNVASGEGSSVSGGQFNNASGDRSSISGGQRNTANALLTWIGGGLENTASIGWSAVSGGSKNTASGFYSSVSGGLENTASNFFSSVSGGELNKSTNYAAWVGGGFKNTAQGSLSSVFGGKELTATLEFQAIP
jgi:hypothetical protein